MAATFGAFFVSQKLKNAESVAEYTKLRQLLLAQRRRRPRPRPDHVQGREGRPPDDHGRQPRRRPRAPARDRRRRAPRAPRHRGVGRPLRRRHPRAGRPLPHAGRAPAHRPHGHDPGRVQRRHDGAEARRGLGEARDRRAGGGRLPDPRPARREPPRAALPRPAHRPRRRRRRSRASSAARAASAPSGTARSTACPRRPGSTWSSSACATRAGNLGTAPAVLPPVPGQVRGKPGITVRELAAQPPVVAVRAGERVAFDVDARDRAYRWDVRRVGGRKVEEGRAAAGKRTLVLRSPRGASGVYLLQVRSGSSRTRVPFLVQSRGAVEAARRRPDRLVARRRQDRRRPRRPAQHARERRPGGVAAGLHAAAARARGRHRAAAHLPRPRGDQVRPHLRHRARPLRRADRDQPPRRDPRRLAAVDPAVARPPPAPLRRVRRARGELRHRVDAPRHADHRRRPRPPDAGDADRPVRRAARAGRGAAHRGRRPHPAAADRAHGGLLARPPDRLRRHAGRVRPPGGVGQAARHARTRSCSPPSARTSPTASARRPRPRASCRARRSRCSPPRGSARGSRSASA